MNSNYSFDYDFVYLLGEQVSLKSLNIENAKDLHDFLQKNVEIYIKELVRKNEEIMGISEP